MFIIATHNIKFSCIENISIVRKEGGFPRVVVAWGAVGGWRVFAPISRRRRAK